MKFVISVILMMALSFGICLYLPWWSIAIVAFIVIVMIPQKPGMAFLTGFLAIAILWTGLSLWLSSRNEHLLAHKVAVLILKMDSPYLLIAITALIGAMVAGFAALTGSYVRKMAD